jgi:hypothetical protein
VSAGLIRKSWKWDYATTVLRQEGSRIERQVAGRIGGQRDGCSVIDYNVKCSGAWHVPETDGER